MEMIIKLKQAALRSGRPRGHTRNRGINPFGPKSDQHQFSPNNISRSSRVKVLRITKLITRGECFDLKPNSLNYS